MQKVDNIETTIKYLDIRYILFASVIGLINSYFITDFTVMLVFCIIQVICLFYLFIKNKLCEYVSLLTISTCFSMESTIFTGTDVIYGMRGFHILGLSISVWMFIPLIIMGIVKYTYKVNLKKSLSQFIVSRLFIYTCMCSIVGIITFMIGDNNIDITDGSIVQLADIFYMYISTFLEIFALIWIVYNYHHRECIYKTLFAIIPALTVVFLSCLVTGNYGNRGGTLSLQVSEIYFLLIVSIILIAYINFNKKEKIVIILSSVINIILSLTFNANGKLLILLTLVPIIIFWIMLKRYSTIKVISMSTIILIVFILFIVYILPIMLEDNILLTVKYNQAMKMMDIFSNNWYDNLPDSPQMRISEFLAVGYEFLNKPWFMLQGKGFGGTVVDRLNLFSVTNDFAFSEWEQQAGAYFSLHETLNNFFLTGGLIGIYIYISMVWKMFKNICDSSWLIFGLVWFMLFYGYHLNIGMYGMLSLAIGVYEIDKKRGSL